MYKKVRQAYISPYWRLALVLPNFMKFGVRYQLIDNHVSNFSRSVQGLQSSDTPKLPFPIDLLRRPYNTVRTVMQHCDEFTSLAAVEHIPQASSVNCFRFSPRNTVNVHASWMFVLSCTCCRRLTTIMPDRESTVKCGKTASFDNSANKYSHRSCCWLSGRVSFGVGKKG